VFGDDIAAYLPEHIRRFSDQLKQFPKFYEKWVYASQIPAEIYQGDVVAPLPSIKVREDGGVDRMDSPAMIISSTCDVQPGQANTALIAPVLDLAHYRENSELTGSDLENHLAALVDNKISNLVFLPAAPGFRPSLVDLANITSVSIDYLYSRNDLERAISLSQCGHYFLLVKLAYHLTRPEGTDARRTDAT
jgi:hypothetical protein